MPCNMRNSPVCDAVGVQGSDGTCRIDLPVEIGLAVLRPQRPTGLLGDTSSAEEAR